MKKKQEYIEKEVNDALKLTPEEILKFGHISYINNYYKCIDLASNECDFKKSLNIEEGYPKKYECGCEVVVYDNFIGNPYYRIASSSQRIVKNKIRKVINCPNHLKIVNERKKLLNELKNLEDSNIEFIPCVVRTLNQYFYTDKLSNRDIISQTVEFE